MSKINDKDDVMEEIKIGDIIRQRREKLNLTQDELCEGLCDRRTISRIENNKSKPSVFIMENILQRLGIPIKDNYFLLIGSDVNILYLQQQIVMYCSRWEIQKAKEFLKQLEEISDKNSSIQQQFILSKKAVTEDLTDEMRIQMLTEAIKYTIPKFDIDNLNFKVLTLEECKIIVNIANIYDRIDENKAIKIYYDLLKITKENYTNVTEYDLLNSMIACCLSQSLYYVGKYYEAILISDMGIENRIKNGRSQLMGELMSHKAYCLLKLGNRFEGEKLLREAVVFMRIMKSDNNLDITIKYAKKEFNIDLSKL